VLPAFFAVPAIPIEPDNRRDHVVSMYFCTYKRQATVCPYRYRPRVLTNSPTSIPPPLFLGDGSRERPTQALFDALTIQQCLAAEAASIKN